jgi:hypothetical protein
MVSEDFPAPGEGFVVTQFIVAADKEWRSRGAEFLTPPKVHSREIRCYMRDPDGHLIEVGQTTGVPT